MFRAQSAVPKISLLGAASQRVWAQSGVTSWRKSAMERFCLARVFDSGSLGSTWEMKWNPDSRRHVVADSRHSTYEMDCAVLIEVRRRSSFRRMRHGVAIHSLLPSPSRHPWANFHSNACRLLKHRASCASPSDFAEGRKASE